VREAFFYAGNEIDATILERVRHDTSRDGFEDGAMGSTQHPYKQLQAGGWWLVLVSQPPAPATSYQPPL
jgi:hypothetical protein